jgi:hypothetical protein
MKWIFSVLLSIACFEITAQTESTETEIDSIGLFLYVGDTCSFTDTELRTKIEGELVRARIKPTSDTGFYLNILVGCRSISTEANKKLGMAVSADIRLGTELDEIPVLFRAPSFSTLLVGSMDAQDKAFFLDEITGNAEDALTFVLKASLED